MFSSVLAKQASYVVLPENVTDKPTVLSFLVEHFGQIGADVWEARVSDGKVHWQDGTLIELDTLYRPRVRVYYYREVASEPNVPLMRKLFIQMRESSLLLNLIFLRYIQVAM